MDGLLLKVPRLLTMAFDLEFPLVYFPVVYFYNFCAFLRAAAASLASAIYSAVSCVAANV